MGKCLELHGGKCAEMVGIRQYSCYPVVGFT